MPIKPSPTIAGKLRKLFSNNKQTIEPAIGDSIPGGSGGGANVLTLYMGNKNGGPWAFKNPECTEEYESYEEAHKAVTEADVIVFSEEVYDPTRLSGQKTIALGAAWIGAPTDMKQVWVYGYSDILDGTIDSFYLWREDNGGGGDNPVT